MPVLWDSFGANTTDCPEKPTPLADQLTYLEYLVTPDGPVLKKKLGASPITWWLKHLFDDRGRY